MASSPRRYTCEIILHRAINVPIGDLNDLSSDPYILASLSPASPGPSTPHPPQSVAFRTATARRTLNPVFDARWIVSGVPASGFVLTLTLLDEDPGNHDDTLGKAVIRIPDNPGLNGSAEKGGGELREGWGSGEREYKVHKRHGSIRTRLGTYFAKMLTRGRVGHRVRVFVSVRVLGPAPRLEGEGEDAERIYTLGPHVFVRHFSPLATRLTSVRSFKANRIQLAGPVPAALRHRYVGFAPFVKAMFRARGIKGIILNRALHQQHRAIYKWDKYTIWGIVDGSNISEEKREGEDEKAGGEEASERPDEAFARKFLEMAEYGTEGRIFTYVIMLDGQWRFTETGEEFAIDLLSKHTMHADVSLEVAYSGEFFIQRIPKSPHSHRHRHNRDTNGSKSEPKSESESESESHSEPDPSTLPPSEFELVIDNDSGTYRPRKDLLPVLHAYLARPSNLGALGRVRAMDGFDERLKGWKERRKEEKRRARYGGGDGDGHGDEGRSGRGRGVVRQASVSSSGSSSSGDEEAVAEEAARERGKVSGEEDGEDEVGALREDAQRAEENDDDDDAAREETRRVERSRHAT